MPGSFPFTKKCDGYKQMVELLKEGTIAPDMAPRDAYRTDPIFLQYSKVAFKSQLKKWKDANGIGDRPVKRVPAQTIGNCNHSMSNHCFIMLLTMNCHWPFTEQGFGGGGGSTKGHEMMEP